MNECMVCSSRRTGLLSRVADRDRPAQTWEVWRCLDCGYGWTLPPISAAEIGAYYPAVYLGDTRRTLQEFLEGRLQKSRSWRRETEKVALVERFVRGGRILDVGCSNGSFLLALDSKRWRPAGVEYIAEVVEVVRSAIPLLEVHQGDIYSAELREGCFDVVTFWHVFEHLYEPRRVLRRVRRLLRPGGSVFISVPNLNSLQARIFGRHWYAFDVPRHLHHYSQRSLEILLRESGFRVRGHRFFSRMSNIHQLKHSLLHWSEETFSSRLPYYTLKPALFLFMLFEAASRNYGSLTTIAQKTEEPK